MDYLNNKRKFRFNNYFSHSDFNNKTLIFFSLVVILFSVVRGLVPLIANNGNITLPAYGFSYFLGLLLSSYGLYMAFIKNKYIIRKEVYYLLITNLFFTLYWVFPLIILGTESTYFISMANKCLFPFTIFAFIKIPEKKLIVLLRIITLVVAGFVFLDFIMLNTTLFPNGYDLAFSRHKILRPEFAGFGFTGGTGVYFRPSGIFGTSSPHDSANMLAILFVFWLSMSFRLKGQRFSFTPYAFLSFFMLLLTTSASNIVAGFVGMFLVLAANKKKIISVKSLFIFGLLITPVLVWLYNNYYEDIKVLWIFKDRLGGKEANWEGLTSYYGTSFWNDLFSFFFGWGSSLDITRAGYYAEQSLVKGLFEYGLLHSIVFFLLLLYPVIIYLMDNKSIDKNNVYPYMITILVGFISLWHYGSILRTTNVFVFYAIYAQLLRKDIIFRFKRSFE